MTGKRGWLERPAAALCVTLGLCAVAAALVTGGGEGRPQRREASFSVTLRHYGVDAREMERTVAIPLEDALFSISGVKQVTTSSENGRVRAFVRFGREISDRYEAVREAAQGVYESLPPSAQRPEIVSAHEARIPVWTAAVSGAGDGSFSGLLERVVKPALEAVEGAGEVEIAGSGLPEIVIALKPEEAAARKLSASDVAAALGKNDILLPGGTLRDKDRDILIMVDGRYDDVLSLERVLIPREGGVPVMLGDIAEIREQDREPDTLSRLNGKKAAVVSVMAGAGADLGTLSRMIREELEGLALPLEFEVLSDRGAEETAAYRSVLSAAVQGAAAVALMAVLLSSRKNTAARGRLAALICAVTVPLIGLISGALLKILGLTMDRVLLAGLAAGIGAAVDAAILGSERLGGSRTIAEGKQALARLKAPLISGSVTTIAALLPLAAMEFLAGGITSIAWAIASVTLVSLVMTLTLLPPLFLWEPSPPGVNEARPRRRHVPRGGFRFLAVLVWFCVNRPRTLLVLGILVSAGGICALIFAGTDAGPEPSEDSVYAQVEFEGGLRAEETDRLLAVYAEGLKAHGGIKNIQTSARVGSGSVLINFDPKKLKTDLVRELARGKAVPGAFVYIPETSASERIWEITLSGEDDRKCRELAEEAARFCAALPMIRETVLNFKEGSKRLTLTPDRERFREAGVSFSAAADAVRRGVHGPVAYKRIGPQGETDVRVRGLGPETPPGTAVGGLPVFSGQGDSSGGVPLRLDSLMEGIEGREPASIRREDRRRAASFSIRTKPMDPRELRDQVMEALEKLELPPGYAVEFDREAIAAAEALSGTALFFLLALLFCYMVIAAANESFLLPLAVLSVVPPSLAIPALCLSAAGLPLSAASACAFVAVSGLAVNASVVTADEIRYVLGQGEQAGTGKIYRALRGRLPALMATSGTTIAGALPFLFLREGTNGIVRILSLVTVLGVGGSFVCSLTIIPALAVLFSKLFRPFEASVITDP